jgi:hypothetical protein
MLGVWLVMTARLLEIIRQQRGGFVLSFRIGELAQFTGD